MSGTSLASWQVESLFISRRGSVPGCRDGKKIKKSIKLKNKKKITEKIEPKKTD
jgi:hypothetical protein